MQSSNSNSYSVMTRWMESLFKAPTATRVDKEKQNNKPLPSSHSISDDLIMKRVAIQKVEDFETSTSLNNMRASIVVPQLQWNDIQVNKLLGKGTFACVHEVQYQDKLYACKSLHEETLSNRNNFLAGAVDLAIEAKLLASLSHENLVTLYGVRAGSFTESLETRDYFLVLDLLVQTLEQALRQEQMQQLSSHNNHHRWLSDKLRRIRPPPYHEADVHGRLQHVAMGIARGMEYLHSHGICFRDLKPSNCGFDGLGNIKIFDLGLARQGKQLAGGQQVGSPRYMAPEVAQCLPHGVSSDVYSYGIVLWEICTLTKPYQELQSSRELVERVVLGDERPSLQHHACFSTKHSKLKILLQGCWHASPSCRPSFTTIIQELELELEQTCPQTRRRRQVKRLRSRRQTLDGQTTKGKQHFWRRNMNDLGQEEEEETVVFDR